MPPARTAKRTPPITPVTLRYILVPATSALSTTQKQIYIPSSLEKIRKTSFWKEVLAAYYPTDQFPYYFPVTTFSDTPPSTCKHLTQYLKKAINNRPPVWTRCIEIFAKYVNPVSYVRCRRMRQHRKRCEVNNANNSPLCKLPVEILLLITTFLSPIDTLYLTYTSRWLAYVLPSPSDSVRWGLRRRVKREETKWMAVPIFDNIGEMYWW
jgi:hypothetical protein